MSANPESVHPWNHCHNCAASPIIGRRYHCESCPTGPDSDLCEPCYELLQKGKIKHPIENGVSHIHGIKNHQFSVHEGKPMSLFDEWFNVTGADTPEPKPVYPFIVRPVFSAGSEAAIGGYGFVANAGNETNHKPVLITALHVMDPLIKLLKIDCTENNKNYTGRELPRVITGIDLFDVLATSWMMAPLGTAGPMLVLPGARIDDEEPYSDRDIAAFWVKDARELNPAPLALQPPSKGDNIWLAARILEKPGLQLFKAVVVEITDRSMVFIYDDPAGSPKYSSGAPILDQKGEVVGILVGGGELKNTKLGHANHVGNIRTHLKNAK